MAHTDKGKYAAKHPAAKNHNHPVVQAVRHAALDGKISCAAAHKIARDCAVSPAEAGRAIDEEEVQITHCQLGIFKHSADRPAIPTDVKMTAALEKAFAAEVVNKRLPCAAAWSIAESFKLTRAQIGAACDRLGIKINACQLGTFR
jgi:phospholipase C